VFCGSVFVNSCAETETAARLVVLILLEWKNDPLVAVYISWSGGEGKHGF